MTCPRRLRRPAALAVLVTTLAIVALAAPAAAQTRYIAFGDSITFGVGDDPNRAESGYPPRLQALLAFRGVSATVSNQGLPGEDTAGGLSRLDRVLAAGGDVLLLMEGTNDVNEKVSVETTAFNLEAMAEKAAASGLSTVHLTVIPRMPDANTDGSNRLTAELAGRVRGLAWANGRKLADTFEVFFHETPNVFHLDYLGGTDKLHPNSAGYDLMAQIVDDALAGIDRVPPVTGAIDPPDGATDVSPDTKILVTLYDFGAGIDLANTKLSINGQEVDTPLSGDSKKAQILYTPPAPALGVVSVGLRSRDLANPPNTVDRLISQFQIAGTTFLPADFNHDGRVDGNDLARLALAFGAHRFDSRFDLEVDLNGDGIIDGKDLAILAADFGKSTF
ncbi:MAG TPA: GDSL-type esterase/lipase family protein [Thermoanaerobaculia bacterium]|nr:GDSL-type esterase/lipase family protein [Thermoanaerobaculia bacterium]